MICEKSYFNMQAFLVENDISVACCGSSFIQYQAWTYGVRKKKLLLALINSFKKKGDKEFKNLLKNLTTIF